MSLSSRTIGLILGPAIAVLMLLAGAPDGLEPMGWVTAALLVLMAIWWATEAIPIPATALLPLVILPAAAAILPPGDAGMATALTPRVIGASYADHIVLLLLGGFIIALGVERWNLHKRIALNVVNRVGTSPRALILGFMIATALISMWISNTATSLMMVPIALSAAAALKDEDGRFSTALLLGVCYAASIGGVATPIGTPTNLIALRWLQEQTGQGIGFAQWIAFGVPAMALLVPAAWWSVTRGLPALTHGEAVTKALRDDLAALGRMTVPERRISMVFGFIAFLWVIRLPVTQMLSRAGFPVLESYSEQNDMMIAMLGAILVFLVPAGGGAGRALLTWEEAERLPWGVLVLFGGGIAIGKVVSATGLSFWIGGQLEVLKFVPPLVIVAATVALVIFATELTSNVATMTTIAPILGTLAVAVGAAPEALFAPAAVAASCAFMLPVATAPNAVIYATGRVPIGSMIRSGFRLNLLGIVIITVIGYWIAPLVL